MVLRYRGFMSSLKERVDTEVYGDPGVFKMG
jgi:hypothetical protein